jgi:hypothetical protein
MNKAQLTRDGITFIILEFIQLFLFLLHIALKPQVPTKINLLVSLYDSSWPS